MDTKEDLQGRVNDLTQRAALSFVDILMAAGGELAPSETLCESTELDAFVVRVACNSLSQSCQQLLQIAAQLSISTSLQDFQSRLREASAERQTLIEKAAQVSHGGSGLEGNFAAGAHMVDARALQGSHRGTSGDLISQSQGRRSGPEGDAHGTVPMEDVGGEVGDGEARRGTASGLQFL
uniref:Uncharacterized protein n=1 Tax=Chromera velia CCMP2878 TaxID=1169474 RepID=A0A0G4G5Z0_9ALVE|eukprot:Cvel_20315.t1-p1 / transcript=Cvel_20315.t1 / gene=Cvel_20315 / organism=Chromera_velia_CCMP2878 / gene_product=hypothetical protein / transcript_product=hypothetical protein / location=Cvel_scaffold1814:7283-9379(-) / protein_length=179 / sequence_SO=supercontig / SO=protein_coding / is_pseudo=false